MNAHEKRQRMRRPETFRRLSVDLEVEREAAKERQRKRDERAKREGEKVKHLPLSTPVKPWSEDGPNVTVIHPIDYTRPRGAAKLTRALLTMETGD